LHGHTAHQPREVQTNKDKRGGLRIVLEKLLMQANLRLIISISFHFCLAVFAVNIYTFPADFASDALSSTRNDLGCFGSHSCYECRIVIVEPEVDRISGQVHTTDSAFLCETNESRLTDEGEFEQKIGFRSEMQVHTTVSEPSSVGVNAGIRGKTIKTVIGRHLPTASDPLSKSPNSFGGRPIRTDRPTGT
jgi:hypothetical protein